MSKLTPDHRRAHVSASFVVALFLLCLAPHCFSESKGLSHSIELGGAVEDADISPDGGYVAAAVRKCGIPGASPACRLDIEIWASENARQLARRTLVTNVGEVDVAIRLSADGNMLVVSDGQEKLRLWRVSDLTEISSIDLGLRREDFQELQKRYEREQVRLSEQIGRPMAPRPPRVMQIETSPSSPLIAVVTSIGRAEMVRAFDLESGNLLHSWSFLDAYRAARPLSWSQDGKRIAIFLPSTRGLKHPERTDPANLLIYDAVSGQLTAKFEVKEEMDSDVWLPELPADRRGRAIFAANSLIVSTRRTPGTFFRPALRVLDSRTGKAIRTIGVERTGVRDPIAVSADGTVLLGFVGRVRKVMDWNDLISRDAALDTKICLWEMPAGKLIFASEELPLIPNRASFRLNRTGNWIIGFDQGTKLLFVRLN